MDDRRVTANVSAWQPPPVDEAVRSRLKAIYEQIMWLARQPHVTSGNARAWHTGIWAERLKTQIRWFTGMVSVAAANDVSTPLCLEHFMRIQARLTSLVDAHKKASKPDSDEFIRVVLEHERVHIVAKAENDAARKAKGDYVAAGIQLVPWADLPGARGP